jgi:hypothetical protein
MQREREEISGKKRSRSLVNLLKKQNTGENSEGKSGITVKKIANLQNDFSKGVENLAKFRKNTQHAGEILINNQRNLRKHETVKIFPFTANALRRDTFISEPVQLK